MNAFKEKGAICKPNINLGGGGIQMKMICLYRFVPEKN